MFINSWVYCIFSVKKTSVGATAVLKFNQTLMLSGLSPPAIVSN